MQWYGKNARKLPWRETTDPYRIWISEIMLQQTQVKTVLPHYSNWFEKFPDTAALASASMDELLKSWEGLGYYRRARFIHQAARKIISEHGGTFPEAFDAIMALPGIGRSTAGAIASFSFGQPTPVLDGNVKRVLKRWHNRPAVTDKQLWAWAQDEINGSANPAGWNQAMMELGATICSSRSPNCSLCPVSHNCKAAFQPVEANAAKKIPVKHLHWQVTLHTCPTRGVWLTRRPDSGIWGRLWTPPITELKSTPDTPACHIHQLTHRKLHLYGSVADVSPAGDGQWVSNFDSIALPTGIHRLLEKHGVHYG
ncbi:MAG: A/G-specific adenine glycosylase [Mariprofundaceae bacterium]|nr:A/G-specific adenine glycosylase [Mariprofundaceae bacterium]